MKFEEIASFDNNGASYGNDMGGSSKKKANGKFKTIIIAAVVIVLIIVVVVYKMFSKPKEPERVALDVNSRLVQSLYVTVHDFKSSSPYWMYQNENSSNISSMTEVNKMVLTYLNLKGVDFQSVENCSSLTQSLPDYGKLVCGERTKIYREDVQRSYSEIFGDKAQITTATAMKVDPKYETYVYDATIDAYLLYTRATETDKPTKTSFRYNYDIYKAEKIGNIIQIYESLEVTNSSGGVELTTKYRYTFEFGDDMLYSYTTVECLE